MMKEEHKRKISKSQKNCKPVIQLTRFGEFYAEHFSIGEASRVTGISKTAISNSLILISGIHLSGGYIFRYKSDYTPERLEQIKQEVN